MHFRLTAQERTALAALLFLSALALAGYLVF